MRESYEIDATRAACPEYPEVLAELDRLQEQKPGWTNAIWVLAGSLVAFLAVGAAKWDWKFTLWIIPVLLFHEAGHWMAMRLCHYRNLRIFFIPSLAQPSPAKTGTSRAGRKRWYLWLVRCPASLWAWSSALRHWFCGSTG